MWAQADITIHTQPGVMSERSLASVRQGALLQFALYGAAYHFMPATMPVVLLKALPIWWLAIQCRKRMANKTCSIGARAFSRGICLGLMLSSLGDIALELDATPSAMRELGAAGMPKDVPFIVGLGSFLVAHILYIQAFRHDSGSVVEREPYAAAAGGAFLGYGVSVVGILWGHLPSPLKAPVVVYATAIATMGYTAWNRRRAAGGSGRAALLGALLFVVSDTVLAVNKFMYAKQLPYAKPIIMATYYAAQLYIAQSALTRVKGAEGGGGGKKKQ